jgi:hypothetical protein
MTGISFLIPEEGWYVFMIICGTFGILSHIVTKEKKIPFIPIMMLSVIIVNIVWKILL